MTVHRNRTHHRPKVFRLAWSFPKQWAAHCPACGALPNWLDGNSYRLYHTSWRAAFITALRHAEEHLS